MGIRKVTRCCGGWPRPSARRPGGRDLAARYGGEEFVLLLPRTEGRQALAIAERLRKSVAALRLPHQDNGGASSR